MTLRICDALFAMPSVRKSVTDVCEVPLVVRLVFEKFNPHVGYCHRKTIIKSNAALFGRDAKERHPRHVLGNSDALRVKIVNKVIGLRSYSENNGTQCIIDPYQHQINNTLQVDLVAEVFVVSSGEASANAMVHVHHTRHTIEPETVEFIFLHIKSQIAEEEAQNLVASIVEESAVPELMSSFAAFVEVQMISSVKQVQTIEHVLARM